jgi:hypothetical protein
LVLTWVCLHEPVYVWLQDTMLQPRTSRCCCLQHHLPVQQQVERNQHTQQVLHKRLQEVRLAAGQGQLLRD